MDVLSVWRDTYGSYVHVGALRKTDKEGTEAEFSYAEAYVESGGIPVSVSMPLRDAGFDSRTTRRVFDGFLPEGPQVDKIAEQHGLSRGDYVELLALVGGEPVGDLLFVPGVEEPPSQEGGYELLDTAQLKQLADAPFVQAAQVMEKTRLSLAGGMAKVGVYRAEDGNLYLPRGAAASTHVLKVGDGRFPGETCNEAIALRVAGKFGLDPVEAQLVHVDGKSPLIITARYDRILPDAHPLMYSGLACPKRLHQEDMSQAAALGREFKYQPTGAGYGSVMARLVKAHCSDPFSNRVYLCECILYSYLVGNCDNHLKNYSLLWGSEGAVRVSPMYDVLCTAVYPQLRDEMGVALCPSRIIGDVRREHIVEFTQNMGVPFGIVSRDFDDMAADLPDAVRDAGHELRDEGFPEAVEVADAMISNCTARIVATAPGSDEMG